MQYNFFEKFVENVETGDLIPPGSNVLMWYSGGKDSNVLLDLLVKYKQRHDFKLSVYLVTVPFMVYRSGDEKQKDAMKNNLDFWRHKGIFINLIIPRLPNGDLYTDDSNLDLWDTKCYSCEKIKTASLSRIVKEQKKDFIIATPHSVYDILGYVMELVHLSGGLPHGWEDIDKHSEEYERLMILARRCYPKVSIKGNPKISYIRPLIDAPSKLFIEYNNKEGIPIIPENCKNIGGGDFVPFKRIPMMGADLLARLSPGANSGKRFAENYRRIMDFARTGKILPPLKVIPSSLDGKYGV